VHICRLISHTTLLNRSRSFMCTIGHFMYKRHSGIALLTPQNLQPLLMPPQRPAACRLRRLRNPSLATINRGQRSPILTPDNLFDVNQATPTGTRDVSMEPATPTSPTMGTRASRRGLQRQRSVHFVHAVLHYNRAGNDLQPWFWCACSLLFV
jgi:hypothetical protein